MPVTPSLQISRDEKFRIYRINFKSLTELELYLKGDPEVNKSVFKTQKSIYLLEDFAGEPLPAAINYCHGGYETGLGVFLRLKKELESVNVMKTNFRRSVPAVVGSRPHVPNFVAGTPKTMFRLDKAKEKKFIDMYINLAYSGENTDEQIRNRGILTLNLITLFESNDIGVNLHAFEASYNYEELFIADVKLKRPDEIINVGKCYYPLCGKEFIRRVLLRVKESMPFMEKWGLGYGAVLPETLIRKYMGIDDKKLLILAPDEMGIKGKDIYEDATVFFERLNLSDKISIPNYKNHMKNEAKR
ncbi:hypothetical protein SAMN02910339_02899 [Lachnospiraceae bacterium YSD2013]|nr:hypothetical protein SAMN02910339_02899 [Lachnospiraceae bacterium YSD2013]